MQSALRICAPQLRHSLHLSLPSLAAGALTGTARPIHLSAAYWAPKRRREGNEVKGAPAAAAPTKPQRRRRITAPADPKGKAQQPAPSPSAILTPVADESPTPPTQVVVRLQGIIAEWRLLHAHRWAGEAAADASGGRTSSGPAPAVTTSSPVAGSALKILAAVQRHPHSFPSLLAFCTSEASRTTASPPSYHISEADAVVCHATDVEALLSFLRVCQQLPRQAAHYGPVMAALLAAVRRASEAASTTAVRAALKRSALLLSVELRRDQFGLSASGPTVKGGAPSGLAEEPVRRRSKRREEADRKWDDFRRLVASFLSDSVLPLLRPEPSSASGGGAASMDSATVEGHLTDYLLLSLAAELGTAVELQEAPWRATAAQAAIQALQGKLQLYAGVDLCTAPLHLCEAHFRDVFTALLLSVEMRTVLPNEQRAAVCVPMTAYTQRFCKAVGSRPDLFGCLCQPFLARRMERLRDAPGTLYGQMCTDIFTAAAAYRHVSSAEDMLRLMESKESPWKVGDPPQRPPLSGRTAQMCYILFCVGFAPEAVLHSDLCLSVAAVELVEITAAASLFSLSFAMSPLPVRVRIGLADEVQSLVSQSSHDLKRLVVSPTEMLLREGENLSLQERMERGRQHDGGHLPAATATVSSSSPKSRHKKRSPKGHTPPSSAGLGVVTASQLDAVVDRAFYVGLKSVTECLIRGDTELGSKLMICLLPLLHHEGASRFLVEAFEGLTASFAERLQTMGTLERIDGLAIADSASPTSQPQQHHRVGGRLAATTLPMEAALVDAAALFQTRLAECFAHCLNKRAMAGRSGAAAPLGGEDVRALTVQEVDDLMQQLLRFTACALLCGVKLNSVPQLTALHTTLLKAKAAAASPGVVSGSATVDGREAFLAVEQLDRLMTKLSDGRFSVPRHPQCSHVRTASIAVNAVVAVHLKATSAAVAALSSAPNEAGGGTTRRQRQYVLSVTHLLFRLASDHPVEAEPASLRTVRTDILDHALTCVLRDPSVRTEDLGLVTLAEVAVIMCVRRSIHHVSAGLYRALADRVVAYRHGRTKDGPRDAISGAVAQRLLAAAATICLRSDDTLTSLFVRMLEALEGCLHVNQTVLVLDNLLTCRVPTDPAPVSRMLNRLVHALESGPGGKRVAYHTVDTIAILCMLSKYDEVGGCPIDVPYGPVLTRLCRPDSIQLRSLSLSDCGRLVRVAASLTPRALQRCTPEERAGVGLIPRQLAVQVLQAPHTGVEHAVPVVLAGYVEVKDEALRTQVLRAFIARAIRAAPFLAPEEVVLCVEALCKAGIYHEYLFSVLLGRVADVTQKFSLELSLRLLRCGTASGHPQVRVACLTAARPVFVGQVRHVLQSDRTLLATVGSVSTSILGCLSDCFPRDPMTSAVMDNIASHHHFAGMAVTKATLALMAARGGSQQDYNALRLLADHCTSQLMPSASPQDLADLTYLLVACGVRSGAMLLASSQRFAAVVGEADGYTLARFATARHHALADVDTALLEVSNGRIMSLVEAYAQSPVAGSEPFTARQAAALLQTLLAASSHHQALVMDAVDALLAYLAQLWSAEGKEVLDERNRADCFSPSEVEAVLRCCVEVASSPKEHRLVVERCADAILPLLRVPTEAATSGAASTEVVAAGASTVWRNDLLLLANTANLLVRFGQAAHPVVCAMFDVLYEKRVTMLQRHLVLDTTRTALEGATRSVHPELYSVVMAAKAR